jgi:uncharacterized protein
LPGEEQSQHMLRLGPIDSRGLKEDDAVAERGPSARITVRRMPDRGDYSRSGIRAILSDGLFCHVGFLHNDSPVVIPMAYGVYEDRVVIHGLPASRTVATVRSGVDVCLAVTIFDGLVLAQGAFDHSMNYRSVVIFGRARWIRSREEKLAALRSISEQALPGRWDDVRLPSDEELRQTHVLAVPLDEASAKIRSGPPSSEVVPWDTWTGVVPARVVWNEPIPDGRSIRPVPEYLVHRANSARDSVLSG